MFPSVSILATRLAALLAAGVICCWPLFQSSSCCCQPLTVHAGSAESACCAREADSEPAVSCPSCAAAADLADCASEGCQSTTAPGENLDSEKDTCVCKKGCCVVTVPQWAPASVPAMERSTPIADTPNWLFTMGLLGETEPPQEHFDEVAFMGIDSHPLGGLSDSPSRCALLCRWLN